MIIEEVGVCDSGLEEKDMPVDTKFAVADYTYESYSGSGYVVAFTGERFELATISHCSCYGPSDSLHFDSSSSVYGFFEFIEDARCYLSGKLAEKVKELYLTSVNS